EDGIRDRTVTGVQTCALPIYPIVRAMIDYEPRTKTFVTHPERGLYAPFFDNALLDDFVRGYPREDVAAAAQRSLEEVVCACVARSEERRVGKERRGRWWRWCV